MSVAARPFSGTGRASRTNSFVASNPQPQVMRPASPANQPVSSAPRKEGQPQTENKKTTNNRKAVVGGVGGTPKRSGDVGPENESSWDFRVGPYYKTLAYPALYTGIRIPDNCAYSTVTFSIVKRFTFTTSGTGFGGVLIGQCYKAGALEGSLIPNATVANIGTAPTAFVLGYTNGTTSTSTQIFGTGATAADANQWTLEDWTSGTAPVPALMSQVRLVSAGLSVRFAGTTSTSGGIMTGAFMPRGFVSANTSYDMTTLSASLATMLPGSVQTPSIPGADGNSGITVTYQPVDEPCNQFVDPSQNASTLAKLDQSLYNPGSMMVIVSDASGSGKYQCCVWLNYEGIPRSNNLIFQNALGNAVDDPIALSAAFNRSQDFGGVRSGTKGFDGLHTTGFVASANTSHPVAQTLFGVNANQEEAYGMVIHTTPKSYAREVLKCDCDDGSDVEVDDDGGVELDQSTSSWQALISEVGDILNRMTPAELGLSSSKKDKQGKSGTRVPRLN
jgi:hypothetical protein